MTDLFTSSDPVRHEKGTSMDIYELVRGPLAWIAFTVFLCATTIRIAIMLGRARRTNRMHPAKSIKGGFKSIFRGLLPLGLQAMRRDPVFSFVTFIFHLCVLATPLFLLAHNVLLYESWQFQWYSLPDGMADVMTLLVIAGTVYFAVRRYRLKEVRSVSDVSDWVLLAVINGVFLSGILAYYHLGPYRPMLIAHILLGEFLLVMIPFTKLVHMPLYFFTRGYLGAEYEIVMDGEGL